jgi:WD40 repeat protein
MHLTSRSAPWIQITDLRSNRTVALLTNHAYFVSSLAFSPDGKTLASGSGDLTIKFWNTSTWKEISTLKGSLEEIWALAFSRDGKLLFSGAKDGTIKVWDGKIRSYQVPPVKLPDDATSFEVLPGCQTPLCWHMNGTLSVWDPRSLRPVGRFCNPLPEISDQAAVLLTVSGDRFLIATKQSGVIVWDLRLGCEVAKLGWGPAMGVAGGVSPDGQRFAFATTNRLTVWDVNSLREITTLPRGSENPTRLCISPGGNHVAIANDDRTVEVWALQDKNLVGSWKAHRQGIRDMDFVGETMKLITASDDSSIALWDAATQQELPRRFHRSEHGFRRIAVSPDESRVVAAAASKDAQLWDLSTGQQLMTIGFGQDGAQYVGFSSDGNTVLSVTTTELKLWQAPSFAEIAEAEANEHGHVHQLKR